MWEIQSPRVRRHVRTLGHITHVAQIALIDYFGVIFLGDAVHLTVFGGVNQIKQGGERAAQTQTTTTTMTNIEHPLKLCVEFVFVIKIRIFPIQRVTGWRFEIAFAFCHIHSLIEISIIYKWTPLKIQNSK